MFQMSIIESDKAAQKQRIYNSDSIRCRTLKSPLDCNFPKCRLLKQGESQRYKTEAIISLITQIPHGALIHLMATQVQDQQTCSIVHNKTV